MSVHVARGGTTTTEAKRAGGRPRGSYLAVCPGSGKLHYARARKDLARNVVWCPECGRALEIQRWDGQQKEPGIPVHRALRGGTYLGRERTLPDHGRNKPVQPDRGAPRCPHCGGRLDFDTDGNGRAVATCPRDGQVPVQPDSGQGR